jgi:hypothetical protein
MMYWSRSACHSKGFEELVVSLLWSRERRDLREVRELLRKGTMVGAAATLLLLLRFVY